MMKADKEWEDVIAEVTKEIRINHNKIIDDWYKAYLAQRYKQGKSIDVGSFTLNIQNEYTKEGCNCKYWFEESLPEAPEEE